jgi:hypothetical protein
MVDVIEAANCPGMVCQGIDKGQASFLDKGSPAFGRCKRSRHVRACRSDYKLRMPGQKDKKR